MHACCNIQIKICFSGENDAPVNTQEGEQKTATGEIVAEKDGEKAIKIDPKTFELKPLEFAPKIAIAGGEYLIPAEKVSAAH
jgi:hypothetical protein